MRPQFFLISWLFFSALLLGCSVTYSWGTEASSNLPQESDSFCNDFLTLILNPTPPTLSTSAGDTLIIDEGTWSSFLDQRITLTHEASFSLRQFDRLPPLFWTLHEMEQERVVTDISSMLDLELTRRGIPHRVLENKAIVITPEEAGASHNSHPLSELAFELSSQRYGRLPLIWGPHLQDPEEGQRPHAPLLLSWLNLERRHFSAYHFTQRRALSFWYDLLALRIYTINPSLEYLNWPDFQAFRGSRAFRSHQSSPDQQDGTTPPEASLRNQEVALSLSFFEALRDLRDHPRNPQKHRFFATQLALYLQHTGVPCIVSPGPKHSSSFDVVLTPVTPSLWQEVRNSVTTTNHPSWEIPGSQTRPILVDIARWARAHQHSVVFNSRSFLEPAHRPHLDLLHHERIVLDPDDAFRSHPMGQGLMLDNVGQLTPTQKTPSIMIEDLSRINGINTMDAAFDTPDDDASPHHHIEYLRTAAEARQLLKEAELLHESVFYTPEQSADLVADQFHLISERLHRIKKSHDLAMQFAYLWEQQGPRGLSLSDVDRQAGACYYEYRNLRNATALMIINFQRVPFLSSEADRIRSLTTHLKRVHQEILSTDGLIHRLEDMLEHRE